MKHHSTDEQQYNLAICTLRHAGDELNSTPEDDLRAFEDLADAMCIAEAYEQIAEALEELRETGIPFETIKRRLAGKGPYAPRQKRSNAGRSR